MEAAAVALRKHRCNTLGADRVNLVTLHQTTSMMTFEGEKHQVLESTVANIMGLPFQQYNHTIQWVSELKSMDPDVVGHAFVDYYYTTFDTNRANVATLYEEFSMITLQGQKYQGPARIVAMLMNLPFRQCKHAISTVNCQPSGPAGGVIVLVGGTLQLDDEEHHQRFSQLFHLMRTPQGSYFVLNNILQLNQV